MPLLDATSSRLSFLKIVSMKSVSFCSECLQRLYNWDFFPSQWKIAKVITLRKPGEKSYSVAQSYCPISLLNHLGKMLETLVNKRLKDWLEAHQKISPFQWGFCRGRHNQGACWHVVEEGYFGHSHQGAGPGRGVGPSGGV